MDKDKAADRSFEIDRLYYKSIANFDLFIDPKNIDWPSVLNQYNNETGLFITPEELYLSVCECVKPLEARNKTLYGIEYPIALEIYNQFWPEEARSDNQIDIPS